MPSPPIRSPTFRVRRLFAVAGGLGLLSSACASEPPPLELDPAVGEDGLRAVQNPRVDEAWLNPEADFASFTGLLIDPVVIEERPGGTSERPVRTTSRHFTLSDADREALASEFARAFAEEIQSDQRLTLASEPGPGVMRLSAGLVDVTKRVRTEQRAGRETTFANTAGELTLVLELRDSVSGDLLARVVDRRDVRSPGVGATGVAQTNPVTRRADLRRVYQRWARLLHQRLGQLQASETGPAVGAGE